MKRFALSLLGVLLVLSSNSASAQVKRGMWVWHTNDIIGNVNGARQALFDFCSQPPGSLDAQTVPESSKPITVLYFYCHSYVNGDSAKKAQLRSFLRDAHAEGIEVEFLDGAADWATTGKSYGLNYLNYALTFNAGASSANEKFDGIQFDVEPYLLATWFSTDIWNSFIDLVTTAQHRVDSVGGLRFGVATPRWYDSNPGRSYLVQLQSKVDYIAVMNYTDNATNMINDAANEIKIADSLGKKVVLGSETLLIDPVSVTFAQEGWSNMEARLYQLNNAYRNNSSLLAIAIHEYDPYKALSKYGTAGVDATAPFTTAYKHNWTSGNGAIIMTVKDVCGTGVNATSTAALSKITLNGSLLTGTWSTAGSVLSFAPTSSLDAGGSIKVIYTPTDASANMRRDTISFNIAAVPLAVAPANTATDQSSSVTLKWNRSLNATAYKLQVSNSSSFTSLSVDTLVTDTTFVLNSLADSITLYWRVKGKALYSESKPSTTRSFSTGAGTMYAGDTTSSGGSTGGSTVGTTGGGTKGGKGKNRTSIVTASYEQPQTDAFSLTSFPNPAVNAMTVQITMPSEIDAVISLLDAAGRTMIPQRSMHLETGKNNIPFDLSELSTGNYFVRIASGDDVIAHKIQVTR